MSSEHTSLGHLHRRAWTRPAILVRSRAESGFQYRPEVDGLRAIAVLPVLLFHAGSHAFSGGFLGVDVFFVISGYLITSLILAEQERGTFSLASFYERRARRILPCLFLVCFCSFPLAWLVMTPGQFYFFAKSAVGVGTFTSNLVFARETLGREEAHYFAEATEKWPLLHTWSLGIEEQFYLLFPLLLLVAWRFGALWLWIGASCLISLCALELARLTIPQAAFYLLPTRAWELLIGATAGIYLMQSPPPGSRTVRQAGSLLGALLIVGSMAWYPQSIPHPSPYTLAPVLGTALVILFATRDTLAHRILSLRPLVAIGLISYGVYLWHQPLLAFARIARASENGPVLATVLLMLSIALAWLSWRFVERPLRDRNRFTRAHIFAAAALGSALVTGMGLVAYAHEGFPQRWNPRALEILSYAGRTNPRGPECDYGPLRFLAQATSSGGQLTPCIYGAEPATIALLGDSHAGGVAYDLGQILKREGMGLRQFTFYDCIPIPGLVRIDGNAECANFNLAVHDTVRNSEDIKTVVLLGRWSLYFEGDRFDNGQQGIEMGRNRSFSPPGRGLSSEDRVRGVGEAVAAAVTSYLDAGKRVVLVYPVPEVGWDVPQYMARRVQWGWADGAPIATSYDAFLKRSSAAVAALDAIGEHPNLVRVRPSELVCDAGRRRECIAELGGLPLYRDDDHLSKIGVPMLAARIGMAIQPKASPPPASSSQ
jgi:peptidoglycan/LPS O-acetylase OafA/YrhL